MLKLFAIVLVVLGLLLLLGGGIAKVFLGLIGVVFGVLAAVAGAALGLAAGLMGALLGILVVLAVLLLPLGLLTLAVYGLFRLVEAG